MPWASRAANCRNFATKAFPEDQALSARWNLGELYAASEQFAKAAKQLDSGLKQLKKPDSEHYFLLANVHLRLKHPQKAAAYLQKAIANKSRSDESWYRMLAALYYEAGQYQDGVRVLQQLIAKFPPNKDYWLQLVGLYQQMKRYDRALAANELAYQAGLLTKPMEILNFANLLSYQDAPYRAAELLEKEIGAGRLPGSWANWEKVANAWTQAREFERAIHALKKASDLHPTGELDYRLGQIHVEQESWPQAYDHLANALRRGNLKYPGEAYLLFGIACYELERQQEARGAFVNAQKYPKTRNSGRQWLSYLNSES